MGQSEKVMETTGWQGANARADAWRGVLQTLLVADGYSGAMGLLPGRVLLYPGEHSLKLGTPGLYDGRPLAFKRRM